MGETAEESLAEKIRKRKKERNPVQKALPSGTGAKPRPTAAKTAKKPAAKKAAPKKAAAKKAPAKKRVPAKKAAAKKVPAAKKAAR
jgi:DNA end-binding protein Ku